MAIGGAFPQLSAMSSPARLRSIRLGESLQGIRGRRVFGCVMKPVVVRFPSRLTSAKAFRYNSTPSGGRPGGAAFLFCGVRAPTSGSRNLEPVQGVGQVNTAHATSAIVPTYARANAAFERGGGCWLMSTEGERYLDFGPGIAVPAGAHAHPHLVEALTSQGSKLWHVSNL